jgi:hypothetical protein
MARITLEEISVTLDSTGHVGEPDDDYRYWVSVRYNGVEEVESSKGYDLLADAVNDFNKQWVVLNTPLPEDDEQEKLDILSWVRSRTS